MNKALKVILVINTIVVLMSCGNDTVPKPKAMLRLDYPTPLYESINTELPFLFEKNKLSNSIGKIRSLQGQNSLGLEVVYPSLKGTIFLTYKKVEGNLNNYLLDAQNITQTHTIKADEIIEQPYVNPEDNVFGMFYEIGGNAASQSQFYVTDSINHFLTGSLYFYVKPNYDSILPAADYLKKDIQHIMETIQWKN